MVNEETEDWPKPRDGKAGKRQRERGTELMSKRK